MIKLSYEEWRKKIGPMEVTDEVQTELQELHGIDARKEVETALRQEYDFLFNSHQWDSSSESNDE